jgi:tetratricopeptide (TPR) repeat protein
MEPVPDHGEIDPTRLPKLLIQLNRSGFNGSLRLRRDRVEKAFVLREGIPVLGESNLAGERLSAQLIASGHISKSDGARVARRVEEQNCPEGRAVLDLELIAARDLVQALREQLRTRLLECFGWSSGTFTLEPGEAPPESVAPLRIDVYPLLQEGIETHWPPERILMELEPSMTRFVSGTPRLLQIRTRLLLDEGVEAFLGELDGDKNLWQALQNAKTPRAMAAAWVLHAVDALEFRDATSETDESEPPEVEIVFGDATGSARAAPRARAAARPPGAVDRASTGDLPLEIAEKFEQLGELDHYAVLGVERDAKTSEIKRAYVKAAKTFHPDALAHAHLSDEARAKSNRVFAEIGKAHSVLSNQARRVEYDASLDSGGDYIDAERIARAETLYRKGEILLRQGQFKVALEYLVPAVDLYDQEPDYLSGLAWALYKKLPSEPKAARPYLEKAVALAGDTALHMFRLGLVLRDLGEVDEADQLLAKARSIDPNVA